MLKRTIALLALLAAPVALAQDLAQYNKALSAFNEKNYEESARAFYEVSNASTDVDLRSKAEYYLAASFQRMNLPFTATIYYTAIVNAGPQHPMHLKGVEGLVAVQEVLDDDLLIPRALNEAYDRYADAWATLPTEVMSRVNYLVARQSYRRVKMDEAKQFFEAVPSDSGIYHRAQYMLGLTLSDPRFPATSDDDRRKNSEKAVEVLEALLKYRPPNRKDLDEVHQLAMLGLGRINYNLGDYGKSSEWYEKIPRFSKFWDQSLFENGFSRFQNDDLGGGLGALQALHAPQFVGAFQPESWILKSTIYYFRCLYEEGRSALAEFDLAYGPMADKLRPIIAKMDAERASGEKGDPASYFKLVDTEQSEQIPQAVLNWVRQRDRIVGFLNSLKQIELEKKVLNENSSWKAAKMSQEVVTYLDQNRSGIEGQAGRETKAVLREAFDSIKRFADYAEIIRFEISKGEKEFAEKAIDQGKLLGKQTLYRPKIPAENWNYWKFQGEFWRDEIGYYQYTLKDACAR